jgi:DNA-binding transcriptional LysR family regulator
MRREPRRSIKQLEASLGVRLFERSTRGTELTGTGFAIAEPAKRLPESLDRACAQLLPNANAAVTWRIAHAPASIERALGCLVSAITQLWPAQNYVCHEMPQDEVAASGLAARTGCGEVPEVWQDRTAPPRSRSPCWTAPRPATAAGPDGWPGNCPPRSRSATCCTGRPAVTGPSGLSRSSRRPDCPGIS